MKPAPAITPTTPIAELPEFLRPEEFAAVARCSKGVVYEEIRRGNLRHCRIGRLVRVPKTAILEWANGRG